jgi:hypothetical protein
MAFDINQWYQDNNKGDVLHSFKGEVTSEVITDSLADIESKLEERNESGKIKKKLYNVLVESLQNLFHHVSETPNGAKSRYGDNFAAFIIKKTEENVFKLTTGNFIKNNRVQFMKDRIEQINYLSKEELKALYKLILNNEEFSDKGGGGLGMIDIARRSGSKLDYNFYNFNHNFSFFSLDINISN